MAGLLVGLAAVFAAGALRWWELRGPRPPVEAPAAESPVDAEAEAASAREAGRALLIWRLGSPDPSHP